MQLLLLFTPIAVAQLTRITDGNINSAVSAWTTNSTTATTVYGDIGGWNVPGPPARGLHQPRALALAASTRALPDASATVTVTGSASAAVTGGP
jgi:hypothetical protein